MITQVFLLFYTTTIYPQSKGKHWRTEQHKSSNWVGLKKLVFSGLAHCPRNRFISRNPLFLPNKLWVSCYLSFISSIHTLPIKLTCEVRMKLSWPVVTFKRTRPGKWMGSWNTENYCWSPRLADKEYVWILGALG